MGGARLLADYPAGERSKLPLSTGNTCLPACFGWHSELFRRLVPYRDVEPCPGQIACHPGVRTDLRRAGWLGPAVAN